MNGTVKCPAGHVLKVKAGLRGKQAACPACGVKFVVPDVEQGGTLAQDTAKPQPAALAGVSPTAVVANSPAVIVAPTAQVVQTPVWHLADPAGRQLGPLPADAVEQLLAAGQLTPDWLVWQQGWLEWRTAEDVFAGRFAPAPSDMAIPTATPVSAVAIAAPLPAAAVSVPTAAPVIVADTSEPRTSSTRVRVARRRSKDAPLVVLCAMLVVALLILVPLVVWVVAYR